MFAFVPCYLLFHAVKLELTCSDRNKAFKSLRYFRSGFMSSSPPRSVSMAQQGFEPESCKSQFPLHKTGYLIPYREAKQNGR